MRWGRSSSIIIPFVADEVMHELHTAIFRSFLGDSCDRCRAPRSLCSEPRTLTRIGNLSRYPDDPEAVVRWPRCPLSFEVLYEYGQDFTPLDRVVEWIVETGAHRDPGFPAGGVRLVREWMNCRGKPESIWRARAIDEQSRLSGMS